MSEWEPGATDRTKMMLFWPIAGFFVIAAFGIGLITMAVFNSRPVSAAATGGEAGRTVEVELGELFIRPDTIETEAGEVTFEVTNGGKIEHNFAIQGASGTGMIAPGDSDTLTIPDLAAGEYTFTCEVAGHADGGMKGTLVVTGVAGNPASTDDASHGISSMSPEEMAKHDAEVTGSFPAETKGVGGTDLEPRIVDGVKVFELTADEIEWEVSPGETKAAFAYNGMVPGPTLRADLGDHVRIVLNNDLEEATTIHFHGMTVPSDMDGVPAISQDAVLPGQSFSYEFVIRNTGSNMYHSHFNAQKQVPMGLLGAFIVPDPEDPAVDRDVTMVLNDGPLGFTLNGKGFPGTAPIVVQRGDTFRIRYMNEGLQIHPMHLHGMSQKVIAKDGHLVARPRTEDTVLVAPGERVDVLVQATEPGIWAFHCHILTHAESEDGMFGMVTALIVE